MIYTFFLRWTILFMLKLWKLRYFYIVFTGNLNLKPQKIVETTFYDRLIYFSTCSLNAISLSTYTWVPVGQTLKINKFFVKRSYLSVLALQNPIRKKEIYANEIRETIYVFLSCCFPLYRNLFTNVAY